MQIKKNCKVKLIVRLLKPIINILSLIEAIKNLYRYPLFIAEFIKFKRACKTAVKIIDLWPELSDKSVQSQSGTGQYFFQDIWCLKKIYENLPQIHYDVGSRIDGFVAQCSVFTKVKFIDIRPVNFGLENLETIKGDLLKLPFKSKAIKSMSCLHVIEHVGLGRYGDKVDPDGSLKALIELQRIIDNEGNLYLGIPIGSERVMFNAHRIFNPSTIIETLNEMRLIEFSAIDDTCNFIKNADIANFSSAYYSLGLFHFRKLGTSSAL